jgi:chaperonin cofactor prefoldin
MKNKVMKFIDFKIKHLENELKELNDSDSKQHSKYVELESMIYILNDLKNDLEVFLTNPK